MTDEVIELLGERTTSQGMKIHYLTMSIASLSLGTKFCDVHWNTHNNNVLDGTAMNDDPKVVAVPTGKEYEFVRMRRHRSLFRHGDCRPGLSVSDGSARMNFPIYSAGGE